MKKSQLWLAVAVIGIIVGVSGVVKLKVIGYGQGEYLLWLFITVLGLVVAFVSSVLYRRVKSDD